MTGLVWRTGRSVRLVRTLLEVSVLAVGWLLGGTVGIGTVLYALMIGPLVQALLPYLVVQLPASAARSGTGGVGGVSAGRPARRTRRRSPSRPPR
jgi:uncharacterized membrane protein YczE